MAHIEALESLAISASGFVFDPVGGVTFTVNPTGRLLLEGLRDGLGLDALAARLSASYDTTGADLQRDVLEYVRALRDVGLLPPSFELE